MMLYISLLFSVHAQPYLSSKNVEIVILNEKRKFFGCSSLADGLYSVRFSVERTGGATLLSGETCFSGINMLSFPAHPTSERTFSWEVASKEGVLYPQRLRREKSKGILLPGIFAVEKETIVKGIQMEQE